MYVLLTVILIKIFERSLHKKKYLKDILNYWQFENWGKAVKLFVKCFFFRVYNFVKNVKMQI